MELEKFDLLFVTEKFQRSIEGNDEDVKIDLYLQAFREILKYVHIEFS